MFLTLFLLFSYFVVFVFSGPNFMSDIFVIFPNLIIHFNIPSPFQCSHVLKVSIPTLNDLS